MSNAKKFALNISSSWCGIVVNVAIVFFLTPFLLSQLGAERYAIWALVVSLTGYYGLLDIGVRSGLTQYLARYLAHEDYAKLNETASTGFLCLIGCAFLVLPLTLVIAVFCSTFFNIPEDLVFETRFCILFTGLSLATQLVFFPYSTVFTAKERFDLSSLIFISGRVVFAVLTFVFLSMGYRLIALCLVVVSTNLVEYLVRYVVAKRLIPQLRVSLRLATRESFREIFTYGGWSAVGNLCRAIHTFSDPLVIAAMLPIGHLAPYAVSLRTSEFLTKFLTPARRVFYPAVVRADAKSDAALMNSLFVKGSRYLILVAGYLVVMCAFNASDFFALWIGDVESIQSTDQVAAIFIILAAAVFVHSVSGVGGQILMGQRRVKAFAWIGIAESICNIGISVYLASRIGIIGVAWGTLLSALLFRAWLVPLLVARSNDMSLFEFLVQVCLPPVLAMLLASLPIWALNSAFAVSGWTTLGIRCLIQNLLAGMVFYFVGLNKQEQTRVINVAANTMRQRLQRAA